MGSSKYLMIFACNRYNALGIVEAERERGKHNRREEETYVASFTMIVNLHRTNARHHGSYRALDRAAALCSSREARDAE